MKIGNAEKVLKSSSMRSGIEHILPHLPCTYRDQKGVPREVQVLLTINGMPEQLVLRFLVRKSRHIQLTAQIKQQAKLATTKSLMF